jgi:hypothetical protein
MGASPFMKQQWAHMRHVSAVTATTPAAEEDIDHRPSWEPTPPTVMREWSKTISQMKRKVTTLTEAKEAAHFRASEFPSSLLHVEADLKGKKPFKEAVTRMNVAGACGLALVRCGELAFSSLGKGSKLMILLSDAISGESPQDAGSLLQLLRDTKEDLMDIRKGLGEIANVGTEIAAGSFNQGVDELRHLVWESPLSKAVHPTLVLCPPSLTHLFGDDARIKEALEAERRRPYQASSFSSKPAFQPRSSKSKSWTAKKSKPARRGKFKFSSNAGKGPGPHSKKGEGQKNQ